MSERWDVAGVVADAVESVLVERKLLIGGDDYRRELALSIGQRAAVWLMERGLTSKSADEHLDSIVHRLAHALDALGTAKGYVESCQALADGNRNHE